MNLYEYLLVLVALLNVVVRARKGGEDLRINIPLLVQELQRCEKLSD